MNENLKKLVKSLDSNFKAEKQLNDRLISVKSSSYYKIFSNQNQREKDVKWILKIKKRLLRMRHRILENIEFETSKELQRVSSAQRLMNLNAIDKAA